DGTLEAALPKMQGTEQPLQSAVEASPSMRPPADLESIRAQIADSMYRAVEDGTLEASLVKATRSEQEASASNLEALRAQMAASVTRSLENGSLSAALATGASAAEELSDQSQSLTLEVLISLVGDQMDKKEATIQTEEGQSNEVQDRIREMQLRFEALKQETVQLHSRVQGLDTDMEEVVDIDPTNTGTCPGPFSLATGIGGEQLCVRSAFPSSSLAATGTAAAFVSAGNSKGLRRYVRITGSVKAYQKGSMDAFAVDFRDSSSLESSDYVDGMSITVGHPRTHVFTLAVGASYDTNLGTSGMCPGLAERSVRSGDPVPGLRRQRSPKLLVGERLGCL
ncbi:unnamed protein product, partial [Polarella glacialis]